MSLVMGVLALQGASEPHGAHLRAAASRCEVRPVRDERDLDGLAGLILPGGESTAMLRLLAQQQLFEPLVRVAGVLPMWGVCAGAILLARKVVPEQPSLALCDVTIARNAYGRQLDSFSAEVCGYPVAFIRAPKVIASSPDVKVRGSHGNTPVWLEQGRIWVTTFHPELTPRCPSPFHAEFVERCLAARNQVSPR